MNFIESFSQEVFDQVFSECCCGNRCEKRTTALRNLPIRAKCFGQEAFFGSEDDECKACREFINCRNIVKKPTT